MQFGGLSEGDQALFIADQAAAIRRPSFVVWIEGLGDVNDDVISIETWQGIEETRSREQFGVGACVMTVTNVDDTFYDSESLIDDNARVKVWAGFDDRNIPIFSGIVTSVMPSGMSNTVTLTCQDNMGLLLLETIKDDQGTTDTPKELLEDFCDLVGVTYDIPSTSETNAEYTEPSFYEQSLFNAMKLVCDTIFSVAWFDEDGELQLAEREWSDVVDFTIDDDNHQSVIKMADTYIINDLSIQYRPDFVCKKKDDDSIEEHRKHTRSYNMELLNSALVSSQVAGATSEEIDEDIEAFKFTAPSGATVIDCIHIMLSQDDAHGDVDVSVYEDDGGVPGTLLDSFKTRDANDFMESPFFAWTKFELEEPLSITPGDDYWIGVDVSALSEGTVYFQISAAGSHADVHAKFTTSWASEDDKYVLHKVRGSKEAKRLVEDMIDFYKTPHERIRIRAPAIPQLQLMDEVLVDITTPDTYLGAYVIESRSHVLKPGSYITVDTLRRKG